MKVQLLGTGSADGWPNAFCLCASCQAARREGHVRGQTGALVDNQLLIDCGPEIPAAANRHGADLSTVRTLLFTHAHPDHVGPA
ncbi:MAG: MBL fold metallo-hydrolase, partial [Actinomycetes bacterium]